MDLAKWAEDLKDYLNSNLEVFKFEKEIRISF